MPRGEPGTRDGSYETGTGTRTGAGTETRTRTGMRPKEGISAGKGTGTGTREDIRQRGEWPGIHKVIVEVRRKMRERR